VKHCEQPLLLWLDITVWFQGWDAFSKWFSIKRSNQTNLKHSRRKPNYLFPIMIQANCHYYYLVLSFVQFSIVQRIHIWLFWYSPIVLCFLCWWSDLKKVLLNVFIEARGGARSKIGAPMSNLRLFGSKGTVLKKVLVTLLGLFGAHRSHSAPP